MNIWANEFTKANPKVKCNVRTSLSKYAVSDVISGDIDIAFISRPLTEDEKSKGLWSAPLALDALVPVICFDNACIQPLVMNGLKKDKLRELFTGKSYSWGQLTGRKVSDKVKVFVQSDSSDNAIFWNTFLGIKPGETKGKIVLSEAAMFDSISRSKNALGYCEIMTVYDFKTGFRKEGIYILPVDFNNSGLIDDAEQFYDKYSVICDAVKTGKLPCPPAREFYVVTKNKPQAGVIKEFIIWLLNIGQNYMPDAGYINIPKAKADAAIQSLK
jgi:phosphate transport system substrate-binding protein